METEIKDQYLTSIRDAVYAIIGELDIIRYMEGHNSNSPESENKRLTRIAILATIIESYANDLNTSNKEAVR